MTASEQIGADETGWRIGGHPAWLHAWVGDRATAYTIDPQRSADVLERVIGRDWAGVLSHDGFASYERFGEAIHQQCVAHVLRRARELLERATCGADPSWLVHLAAGMEWDTTAFDDDVHVRFQPSWRSPGVVALTRGIEAAQDFSGMPALADALQEAGCECDDILTHCRGPGPHARGCWVIDLVLGEG